jgi:hypothetical protein
MANGEATYDVKIGDVLEIEGRLHDVVPDKLAVRRSSPRSS